MVTTRANAFVAVETLDLPGSRRSSHDRGPVPLNTEMGGASRLSNATEEGVREHVSEGHLKTGQGHIPSQFLQEDAPK